MFDTSFTLKHTTPVPSAMSRDHVLNLLHNAEHHVTCDPNMKSYVPFTPPKPHELPKDIDPIASTVCYAVTDSVPTPVLSKVWERESVSRFHFTNTQDGCYVYTMCPLSVTLDTRWTVLESANGGLELEEAVEVKCSRIWAGLVKEQLEKNWKDYHKVFLSG
ncbi:hypothetical protein CTRI78_v005363 [Colletotrichum trifolii]|uniref:DUF7053 domain-containing protein n=1 Tax=Colletotrichum trifolii TaxID=5466 RepID=A0A4R8RRG0_COLTR|nr:hypothetical protein CTRI78_v005363 [Colletotrichum trifolii]